MAIKTYNPTSAGTRFRKTLVRKNTRNKSMPEKSLLVRIGGAPGRSHGRVSSMHKQVGNKKFYRIIDFKRNKRNISAKVASIEYDPYRGPSIALLHYADGEKRYILAPAGLEVGMTVSAGSEVELKVGNALPLAKIPLSMEIHNIEVNPGRGGQMVRGAGNAATIMAKEENYVNIKLPSGEVKKVSSDCYATIGSLGNEDWRNVRAGKAGRMRHRGWRPVVRGVAHANPSDHPHGGSYKDKGVGMPSPKSPWGWKTKGKKTRRRVRTDKYLVKDRRSKI